MREALLKRAVRWAPVVVALLIAVAGVAFVMGPRSVAPEGPGSGLPTGSPSPTAALTPVPAAEATPMPSLSPSSAAAGTVSAVFLLDTRLDRAHRLTETPGYVIHAAFHDQRAEVVVGTAEGEPEVRTLHRFDLGGNLLERERWPDRGVGSFARCVEIRSVYPGPPPPGDPPPVVEVDGRRFENASCGRISPDNRWMTYWLWAEGASAASLPIRIGQWLIDLDTGERRLLKEDLVHCGGCDGVPGPKWSSSGRYVYFSDVVGGGDRFFLSDVVTGTTRQLTDHVPREEFDVPAWSPAADTLLYSNGAGATVIEDLAVGRKALLPGIAWPARFDPTGAYVFSPAWPSDTRPGKSTTVLEVRSARVVASLLGQPEPRTYIGVGGPPIDRRPVIGDGESFVAALQGTPGCAWTAIYRGSTLITCVADGVRPEISPDGKKVALARATGEPVPPGPCNACFTAEVIVIDVALGREVGSAGRSIRIVMSDVPVTDPTDAVEYSWNRSGTHLLVAGRGAR